MPPRTSPPRAEALARPARRGTHGQRDRPRVGCDRNGGEAFLPRAQHRADLRRAESLPLPGDHAGGVRRAVARDEQYLAAGLATVLPAELVVDRGEHGAPARPRVGPGGKAWERRAERVGDVWVQLPTTARRHRRRRARRSSRRAPADPEQVVDLVLFPAPAERPQARRRKGARQLRDQSRRRVDFLKRRPVRRDPPAASVANREPDAADDRFPGRRYHAGLGREVRDRLPRRRRLAWAAALGARRRTSSGSARWRAPRPPPAMRRGLRLAWPSALPAFGHPTSRPPRCPARSNDSEPSRVGRPLG